MRNLKLFIIDHFYMLGFWLLALLVFHLQGDTRDLFNELNRFLESKRNEQVLSYGHQVVNTSFSKLLIANTLGLTNSQNETLAKIKEYDNLLRGLTSTDPMFNKFKLEVWPDEMAQLESLLEKYANSNRTKDNSMELSKRITEAEKLFISTLKEAQETSKTTMQKIKHNEGQLKADFWYFYLVFLMSLMGLAYLSKKNQQSRKAIQTSEALHRYLLGTLSEGVLVCLNDGSVLMYNKSAQNILGLKGTSLKGFKLEDLFPMVVKEDGTLFQKNHSPLSSILTDSKPLQNVILGIYQPNGDERWIMMSSQPIYDIPTDSQISAIISFFDVSERIQQQKEIEKQQTQIINSSKLATLGELAGSMAHEINNPLSIIQFEADHLTHIASEIEEQKAEQVNKIAKDIERTVDRITKIIRGVLNFARDGSRDSVVNIRVKDIIEEANRLCKHKLLRSSVNVDIEGVSEELMIKARETQLTQAFLNLISNSADAISDQDEPWIEIKTYDKGGHVEIHFTDSGSGIPKEISANLFQPFFTTKKAGSGTGIGMSITKDIIEEHKGSIYIDENCKNTRFVVEIPKDRSANYDEVPPLPKLKAS